MVSDMTGSGWLNNMPDLFSKHTLSCLEFFSNDLSKEIVFISAPAIPNNPEWYLFRFLKTTLIPRAWAIEYSLSILIMIISPIIFLNSVISPPLYQGWVRSPWGALFHCMKNIIPYTLYSAGDERGIKRTEIISNAGSVQRIDSHAGYKRIHYTGRTIWLCR